MNNISNRARDILENYYNEFVIFVHQKGTSISRLPISSIDYDPRSNLTKELC